MVTDQTGAVVWDQVFGPWGQIWQQTGTRPWFVFAGLRWPVNDPLKPSATREFSSNVFRWMTPDPGGVKVVKLDDPQTWNMYAYVTNNPTSLTDPSGLCTGGPLGWATAGYCGLRVDPWGHGAGAVVGGYDIFDALEGVSGAEGLNITLVLLEMDFRVPSGLNRTPPNVYEEYVMISSALEKPQRL